MADAPSATTLAALVEAFGDRGWADAPGFLPPDAVGRLAEETRARWRRGGFRPAGVGRGDSLRVRPEIRDDQVCWIDAARPTRAQARYLAAMEVLRRALNQGLWLGLFGFEAHLTVYPPGARYQRHLDRFAGASHRAVSAVLYLNETWDPADGGALRLYLDERDQRDLAPLGGRLVLFRSERFEHEVLPAARERVSATGWFTRRP